MHLPAVDSITLNYFDCLFIYFLFTDTCTCNKSTAPLNCITPYLLIYLRASFAASSFAYSAGSNFMHWIICATRQAGQDVAMSRLNLHVCVCYAYANWLQGGGGYSFHFKFGLLNPECCHYCNNYSKTKQNKSNDARTRTREEKPK